MLPHSEQRCVWELSSDQHWLQWGGQNKAGPFTFTMGTLSARTGEGRGNKQNTRVSQTTCHKAFSRTGLTGTPSSHPVPGVRQGSPLWCIVGEVWRAEGEIETRRRKYQGLVRWRLNTADFWHLSIVECRFYVRCYYTDVVTMFEQRLPERPGVFKCRFLVSNKAQGFEGGTSGSING